MHAPIYEQASKAFHLLPVFFFNPNEFKRNGLITSNTEEEIKRKDGRLGDIIFGYTESPRQCEVLSNKDMT